MNEQTIQYMSVSDIVSGIVDVQAEPNDRRAILKAAMFARLAELKADKDTVDAIKKAFQQCDKADQELADSYTRKYAQENADLPLKFDSKGRPVATIENFLMILRNDTYFANIKFNELSYRYERYVNGKHEEWKNVDDSKTRGYIETKYHIHHKDKLDDAMRIVFDEHRYHPVKEIIEAVKWDGVPRMKDLFIKWLKCEDSDYAREVTRLVFAGGINRIYNPGCKFDDVCVLVGTLQGEGKSTFVRWLALDDKFFTEVKSIENKDSLEIFKGKWICEIAELMAVTKTKDVETVKSFISTQTDRYRMSYDKRPEDYPRQCVFIGTTNKEQFLTDKTGNRRWYPLKVHSTGYDLFNHEKEIRADIIQCWAEAKALYDKGELKPFADFSLVEKIREKQAEAVEDDYRIGLIENYLKNRDTVCILEIWKDALDNMFSKPTRKESNDIALMLQSIQGWERGKRERTEYGIQLCWHKTKDQVDKELLSDLPDIEDVFPEL